MRRVEVSGTPELFEMWMILQEDGVLIRRPDYRPTDFAVSTSLFPRLLCEGGRAAKIFGNPSKRKFQNL
jgi:hypothetical protein